MPVEQQNTVPQFFAGQTAHCPLPAPLPVYEEFEMAVNEGGMRDSVGSGKGSTSGMEEGAEGMGEVEGMEG